MSSEGDRPVESGVWPGWEAETVEEDVEGNEIVEGPPPPTFHSFFKLPSEIREMIWDQVIEEDECDMLTVRECSRAAANEAMAAFSKHLTFYMNPEKDSPLGCGNWAQFTTSMAPHIKNLNLDLSRFYYHRFRDPMMSDVHTTDEFEDESNVLGAMVSQPECLRGKCFMTADFDGHVFKVSDKIMSGLDCLKAFRTVEFSGSWNYPVPYRYEDKPPKRPFEDFKDKLEQSLGPATRIKDCDNWQKFEFYPREFLGTGSPVPKPIVDLGEESSCVEPVADADW